MSDWRVGYADWLGYGHGERADKWLARLEVNRPELEAFRAAKAPACEAYVARAARVRTPDESEVAVDLKGDAREAIERARANATLNAFTWIAKEASGFPVAVKDLMEVRGAPFTNGSKAFDRFVPDRDAEVVARLRRAGAGIVGLTNLHEFAYGITSANPHFGHVQNPAAPSRIPGGSSGGSAAAIAAGIVRLAVGTDTAGSIRIPAACCGIVGLKPSYDAIPRIGVTDLAFSLDHVGPMAASVPECGALFSAMLGVPTPPWGLRGLSGVSVARLRGFFDEPLDREVRKAVDEAAHALASDGANVSEREIAGMELAPAVQLNTIVSEATAYHAERVKARGEDYGEDVRVRIEMGFFFSGPGYVKAQRIRTALVASIEAALEKADVFLCATLRSPAPPIGASRVPIGDREYPLHTAVTSLTMPFNLSGLPAITIPWGRSSDGVPLAVQIVGRRGEDWKVLGIAQRLESLSPGAGRLSP